MREKTGFSGLDPKQEQLIYALLRHKTKAEAAAAAGIHQATMYRWFQCPKFKAAYREARRDVFDEALAVLQKGARQAAQMLVDETEDPDPQSQFAGASRERITAAKAVLASVFRAHGSMIVEEELEQLREVIDVLKAGGQEPQEAPQEARKDMLSPEEQTEATRLRVSWMNAFGFDPESIQNSLRFNRPQSVAEEQYLFDLVQKLIEEETQSPPPDKE